MVAVVPGVALGLGAASVPVALAARGGVAVSSTLRGATPMVQARLANTSADKAAPSWGQRLFCPFIFPPHRPHPRAGPGAGCLLLESYFILRLPAGQSKRKCAAVPQL